MRPKLSFLIFAAIIVLASSACSNPRTEANVATALNDAATEIGGLKSDMAVLQDEIDSLRVVIAKQDTSITHIAAVNNVPITR